jgi:hypothetical protein
MLNQQLESAAPQSMQGQYTGAGSSVTSSKDTFTTTWTEGSGKDITIKYKFLDDIVNATSMRYTMIPLPDFHRSEIVESYGSFYNARQEKNVVTFYVEGRPCDTKDGKKLISSSFALVRDVYKSAYQPETATIMYKNKEGQKEQERHIDKCVIIGVDLHISSDSKQVVVRYTMQGILEKV